MQPASSQSAAASVFATFAHRPWVVAASVPAVIYTIPASSPLHYVTYVRIYEATPQVVYVGYTPGYKWAPSVSRPAPSSTAPAKRITPWIGELW